MDNDYSENDHYKKNKYEVKYVKKGSNDTEVINPEEEKEKNEVKNSDDSDCSLDFSDHKF